MAYNIPEETAAVIRAAAVIEGREHCENLLYAFRMGFMHDNDLTVDGFVEEYGVTHGDMSDILPDIVPAAWEEWNGVGDVGAMAEGWELYAAFFAEGFYAHAYAAETDTANAIGNG